MSIILEKQLADLQEKYAKELLAKIDALEEAWVGIQADNSNTDAMRDFHRMAHTLAGSGKTFGYPAVSAGAQGIERIIEDALARRAPLAIAAAQKIERFLGHLRRAAQSQPAHNVITSNIENRLDQTFTESRTILVVDDDPNIRSLLKIKLEVLGFKVISAYDGQEGYAKALSENPDLIITDHNMPTANSDYMLSNIRANNATKNIPSIVITAQKIGNQRDHALQRDLTGRCGAIAYFEKPVDFEALLQEIKRVIPIRR